MQSHERQEQPSQKESENGRSRRDVLKTLILVVVLTGSLALVRFSPLGYYLDPMNLHILRDKLAGFDALAPILFLAGGSLLIAIGVPRTIFSILGGMVFGFLSGTLLATAAAFAGSLVIFQLTRFLGRPLFHQKIGHRLQTIEEYLKKNGLLVVILIRQLPLPSLLINVLLALTSIRTTVFAVGSLIGLLPEAAIFALFGSSVRGSFLFRVTSASFLMILLIVVLRRYYKRSEMARELTQKLTSDKT